MASDNKPRSTAVECSFTSIIWGNGMPGGRSRHLSVHCAAERLLVLLIGHRPYPRHPPKCLATPRSTCDRAAQPVPEHQLPAMCS